ncbi:MAG: acyl dehydratase [Dehalococcoidia bacterium]|nr:acyl dehydratase [Dehalococcoidia bacterium]
MPLKASQFAGGQTHEEVVVDKITRTQIVQYAGASGAYNPLHTDETYAQEVAWYPTAFAHDMLSMGLTGTMITNWVGDGRLTKFGVRFSRQVWPWDTLTVRATVEVLREEGGQRCVDLALVTVNKKGEEVVHGSASARVDP